MSDSGWKTLSVPDMPIVTLSIPETCVYHEDCCDCGRGIHLGCTMHIYHETDGSPEMSWW